ncbi:MAG: HAMP domain-containing histidine kinase [Spirochaetales bacterium]|nr:HAMP domain-containing histidine kinase [Spirochaetales bacterium]
MKRSGKRIYVVYLLFILLYTGITALVLWILSGESLRHRILIEYEAERSAAMFMETLMRNSLSGSFELPENVLGFGIYKSSGEKISAWGDAPEYLDSIPVRKKDYYFIINRKKQSLILIRRTGFHHRQPGPMPFMMRRQPGNNANLLYFELDASAYLHQVYRIRFLGIFIAFFLLAAMIGLLFLYTKNRGYRRKLESREQLARLGEIARVLAHEIKNPLGAMRIQTGYLKKVLPEKHISDLSVIEEEIDRLSHLTNRISDFVRDPSGSPEKIALESFLQNLLKRFNSPVTFIPSLPDDTILFDRERLRSVLENVINNALESQQTGDGNNHEPVKLELMADKKYIVLSVIDRGTGIPPEKRDKIFDPFYTTRAKGSGIGLSITKRFLEANGGKISLQSREGGGTEVKIFFQRTI